MLYMIAIKGKDSNLIKIGQTENLNKRMAVYRSSNPLTYLLHTVEVNKYPDIILEKECQDYLATRNYKWISGEWYEVSDEELELFEDIGFNYFTFYKAKRYLRKPQHYKEQLKNLPYSLQFVNF